MEYRSAILRATCGLLLSGMASLAVAEDTALAPDDWSLKESPMLNALVQSGELPALEDRLPANPAVVQVKEIGTFGDTMVNGVAFLRSEYIPNQLAKATFTTPTFPLPSEGPILPNVASSWEYNEDGTEITLHLREGMKWSDGEPFTADDIEFYWNDILLDENVPRTAPSVLSVGGEMAQLEKIDDVTIKFKFKAPYYFADTALATTDDIAWPKHIMSKFHPKYNSDSSYEELNENLLYFLGRGKVTIGAWVLEEYFPGEKFVLVRNPYYWKVDQEGNQLPYFDRVEIREVEDRQAVALGNVSGEFDSDGMWVGVQHLQLFLSEQENRKYDIGYSSAAGMAMYFNFDAEDETARNLMRDVNFRRAFSIGINRDEISFVAFNDLLTPRAWAWSPLSSYYDEEVASRWIDYDPEQAAELLEAAGMVDVDGDGMREAPDGSEFQLIVDVSQHDLYVKVNEMIREQLAEIGLDIVLNVQHQDLIEERRSGKEWSMHVWDLYGTEVPLSNLALFAPINDSSPFWHQDSASAPFSAEFAEYSDLMLSASSLPSEESSAAIIKAGEIMADNVFGVYLGDYERPFIKSHRLGNMPDRYARIEEFGSNMPAFQYDQVFGKWDRE